MKLLRILTKYREKRVYRIVVTTHGGCSVGSGFFIQNNKFLTCFHVAFAKDLRSLRKDPDLIIINDPDEHSKLQKFYNNKIAKVEVELHDGTRVPVSLIGFEEKYDIALFAVELGNKKVKVCKLEWHPKLIRGDYIFFSGYPTHHDYALDQAPLAVQEGMVSSIVDTVIGGEKYKHLQINSINLGGNSGAPLFKKWGNKVVGIVNGNMNFGSDYVMIQNPVNNQATAQPLRIPLSIAYATSLDTLKENTNLFE